MFRLHTPEEIDAKHLLRNEKRQEETMNKSTTIGIDLAKTVFFVVVLDQRGKQARRKKLRRSELLPFLDRKSTRLNSSHVRISYAVFCVQKIKLLRFAYHAHS